MDARRRDQGERSAFDASGVPLLAGIGSVLTRNWWVVALRGGVSVLFGVLALLWPAITFVALVLLFGAYAFVDGLFALGSALSRARWGGPRWPLVLRGAVGIGIGVVTVLFTGLTAAVLLALIAVWALVGGVFEIVEAVRLRREVEGEWLLALAGALSVAFGLLVLLYPAAGALSVVWLIGMYAIAFGVVLVALGFRLRRAGRRMREEPGRA